ncbi:hypothetical protein MD484_g6754, partial [Candolleomyces efflorescens]
MAKDRRSNGKRIRYDLQEKPTKGDTALETADLVFTSVATAASMSPIPLVGEAAGLVLEVLTIIQDIQDNKDQFKQLAQHAMQLVDRAISACSPYRSQKELPKSLRADLKTLISVLEPVRDYSAKKLERGWFKRVVFRRHDEQVIRNYYNHVKNGLDAFNMSSHIELRQGQAEILQRLDAQQAQASSKTYQEPPLLSPQAVPYSPPTPEPDAVNLYSPPPDWPFGPGFPFNRVSSPVSYHSPPTTSPPMMHRGNSYNSGNVVVTNVVNSNNDHSNNFYQYSRDYSMPQRGPTWKHHH